MASSPLPGGSRHVGRVIDPAVRDDGEPEPSVELESEASAEPSPVPADPEPSESPALARGGRARELLIERAQAARAEGSDEGGSALSDIDDIGKAEGEARDELELSTAIGRAPSAPFIASASGRLSPNLLALFGTLLGVATVASLVALGMNIDMKAQVAPASAIAPMPSTPAPAPTAEARPKRQRTKVPGPWRIEDARTDTRLRVLEGKMSGDAFLKALEKSGVETHETYRILTSMKGVRDFDHCKPSDHFLVLVERGSSKVKAFEYITNPEDVFQSREGADGLLKGTKLDLKVERHQISGALAFDGKSFDQSAEQGGFDRGLAKTVAKALDGHMSLDEIERGARIRVIAQEVTVLGDFARYAGIEALEIQAPDGSKPFRLYYVDIAPERGYYDADGHSPYEGGFRKPIEDAAMTSPYNLKRMHPILKKVMPHLGIDFGAPMGTPVGAASSGIVAFASYVGPTGNLVRIEHANGIETGYAHLSRFAEGLKVGDKVKRKQLIGYVGSTGRSTGPHLHFSARRNGEFFDPATLNLDALRTLSKDSRAAFAELKAKYDALLDAIPLPPPMAPVVPAQGAAAAAAAPAASPDGSSAPQAAPAAHDDPAAGEEDDEGTAPASAGPPAGGAPKPTSSGASSVYLSDKELLKLQGATDEGEVSE